MLIKSFQINHTKLIPGIYLYEVKKIDQYLITTFDWRFKKPNGGDYLSNLAMHSLEHIIATFYTNNYPEKIYFGPMGCQTGFYLVVGGQKDLDWLDKTLPDLNTYILNLKNMPGQDVHSCGQYQNLDLNIAKQEWTNFYQNKNCWGNKY